MQRYIVGRVFLALVTLLALSVIIFLVARVAGDPVILLTGGQGQVGVTAEDVERLRHNLGLDRPLPNQYWDFVTGILQGDFGDSLRTNRPVLEMMKDRFPTTMKLAAVTAVIAVPLGLFVGVIAAINRGRRLDFLARAMAVIGQSLPSFFVAIMLLLLFSVQWEIFPPIGLDSPMAYVLPVITLGIFIVAGLTRLTRSAMLEVLSSDYITFARARGASETQVIFKHALKNAAIPLLTIVTILLASIITGSVIVETVFAVPGLGRLAFESIIALDFPVIQAIVLFYGVLFIGANLLADILYAWVDPRIRYT